jgi:general secretion pathway protein E
MFPIVHGIKGAARSFDAAAEQSMPEDHPPAERSLGQLLVDRGKLSPADLERALRLHKETHDRVDLILTRLGLVSERDIADGLATYLGTPVVAEDEYPVEPLLAEKVSARFLKEHRVLPIADLPDGLAVAMADPLDGYVVKAMEFIAGKPIIARVGLQSQIETAYERLYGSGSGQVVKQADDAGLDASVEDVERLKDLASEAPVIRLVNRLIAGAFEMRASDIHIEPFERTLRVRYRIDGVLHEIEPPPWKLAAPVISRVKIMANLNIAERRLPQDGRIKLALQGKEIDMRVSTVPTMHGESVVMRVLDRRSTDLKFEDLGFDEKVLPEFIEVLERPHGICLVTGPTGSGKTTTLYTALRMLNSPEVKILTVEDPVEYQLQGINQVHVKPQIGLTFAHALRSFLRQDPDIIMIGEIRDVETAQIAVQASLTGHLVLSTLHTNDAASAISRLLDMGVEDYLLTATMTGVVAQRLVRTLCPNCRQPYAAMPELVAELRLDRFVANGEVTLFHSSGCKACGGTGFRGRSCILEFLPVTDAIRKLVLNRADARDIQRAAIEGGMRTMYQHGVVKALAGATSLEEVMRVTREV